MSSNKRSWAPRIGRVEAIDASLPWTCRDRVTGYLERREFSQPTGARSHNHGTLWRTTEPTEFIHVERNSGTSPPVFQNTAGLGTLSRLQHPFTTCSERHPYRIIPSTSVDRSGSVGSFLPLSLTLVLHSLALITTIKTQLSPQEVRIS